MTNFQILKDDLTKKQVKSLLALEEVEQWADWNIYADADFIIGETELDIDDAQELIEFIKEEFEIDDSYIEVD